MTYQKALQKKKIELILMMPFILLGNLAGQIFRLKTKHHIFLFFPSADIGGSVKVNAEIAECIKDLKPLIIFSKKPKNNQFIELFKIEGVRVIDLHRFIDYKIIHFINFFFRGVLATWINKVDSPVVFGGESLFFYKMLPHVKKRTKRIELCHLNTWFNYSQAFIEDIDLRIFSTLKIKKDVESQYQQNNISPTYYERLKFIDNKIDIPALKTNDNDTLQILFVGRGAPQKRVHIIAEIASRLHRSNSKVHFSFVGDVENVIPEEVKKFCTLYGNVKEIKKLYSIYAASDVLILTSAYEGLPLVVMDMMARGKVILSTAVDGIPDYITHRVNGLLMFEKEEEKIAEEGVALINLLLNDVNLKHYLGNNAYAYAKNNFSKEKFDNFYRSLFLADKNELSSLL